MNYIISIDIGSSYSGSCFTSYPLGNTGVSTWFDENGLHEKTHTACLYKKQSPLIFLLWGSAAVNYVRNNPNDSTVFLVKNFKHTMFINVTSRVAMIDYLRELYLHTCIELSTQMNEPHLNSIQLWHVITVPDVWSEREKLMFRSIASAAGIPSYPNERLIMTSESEANALYFENLLNESNTKKRYLICDIGERTTNFSVYELTNSCTHCQLLQQSVFNSGSFNLNQRMNTYLNNFKCYGLSKRIKEFIIDLVIRIKPISEENGEIDDSDFIILTLPHPYNCSSLCEFLFKTEDEEQTPSPPLELKLKCTDIVNQVFDPFIDKIIVMLEATLIKSSNTVDTIFLSGGSSESSYIYHRIYNHFSTRSKNKIIVLRNEGERVTMIGGIYSYANFYKQLESVSGYFQLHPLITGNLTIRKATRNYAIHFLYYPIDGLTNDLEYESEYNLNTGCINLQHIKDFYLLIAQGYPLPIATNIRALLHWKFHVQNPCDVIANLYAYETDQDICHGSVDNIIRLHRFKIPVRSIEHPITVHCQIGLYFLLFTIIQDYYVADFRCNDLMYTEN